MTSVTKSLAVMEDLLCGKGQTLQTRAGVNYTVGKLNIAYSVESEEALNNLDTSRFTFAELNNTLYIYSTSPLSTGVKSNRGSGVWVKAPVTVNVQEYVESMLNDKIIGKANTLVEHAFDRVFLPKDGSSLVVGDAVTLGVDALVIADRVHYLFEKTRTSGVLTAFDDNSVTIGTDVYKSVFALPTSAAVESSEPQTGFGGFRYTVTDNGDGTHDLNLFTS